MLGILEQLQVPLAEVREQLGVRGMDVEEARHFRDKSLMKIRLAEHGLPCARHVLAESASQAREFASRVGYPLVVKPPAGAGARGTFRVADDAELESYLASIPPSAAEPVAIEEFIPARSTPSTRSRCTASISCTRSRATGPARWR